MQTSRYATKVASPRIDMLEGVKNFRDIGGFATHSGKIVRQRLLFRSEGQHSMTFRDADYLQNERNIQAVIDLRSTEELHLVGPSLLVWRDIPMFHIPIVDQMPPQRSSSDENLIGAYLSMLDEAGPRFAAAVEIVAEISGPVTFHGTAGRDRTGLLSAILLSVLGVADRGIGADYCLSLQAPALRPTTVTTVMALLRAEHGSVEEWLVHHGLDEAACPELRDRLLHDHL